MASEAEGCWFDPSQSHHVSPLNFDLSPCFSFRLYGVVLLSPPAGLPDIVRLCFGQPCSPCESGRFRRPSPRSAYTYTPSGASPAVIDSLSKVPPGFGPKQSRALHFWSSSARCSGSRPLSRSLRRRSRRLRGDTRRNASSAGYRLLALRRVSPRIRRTASLHVAQFGTRPFVPCLTFHKARFSSQHLRSPTSRQLA